MESMDVMRDVKSMSYVELKKYAKELGIELEDAKKVKKEGLIEKIKSHFEQKVMESVRQQAAESEEKPKTRKKKVLKKQAAVEEIIEEPVVVEEPVPVKKSSRRKEKSAEQVVEEAPVQEKTKVVKKKTKKSAPTIESVEEPVQAEITPAKEKKTKKVIKKKSKKSMEEVVNVQPQVEQQVEAPSSTKKVRKVKKVKKTTPTKKTKKTKSTRGVTVKPVVEHSPESNIEPLVLTNSPEPVVVTTQQVPAPIAYEIVVQTPRPSRQSIAKLNNSAKQISKSASKTNNKSTRSSNRLSKSFNASLLTNDDEEENREADITNDVQNTTFDKPSASQPVVEQLKPSLLANVVNSAKKVLACSSFYLTSATNNSPFKIPPIANEPVSVTSPKIVAAQDKQEPPKVVPIVEPIAEASQAQQPAPTDPAKRMGGARIVKPTQTVLIKTTIVKENNVVVEQLREEKVEAVRREAGGPRIVKPVEEKIETKKTKISDAAAHDRAKKIKSSTNEVISRIPNSKSTNDIAKKPAIKPVPDFKAIHNKEANKFESIDSWADRVQNRHMNINEAMKKKLTPAKKQPETKSTPSVVVSSAPVELTSNKDSKIPLVKKPVVAQPAAKLPSTPNFNESKVDMGRAPFMSTPNNRAPTTPQLTGPKNDAKLTLSTVKKQQQQPKTPASASRPKPQFNQLLKVAVTNNASQASQTSVATAETNKPVLQAPPTGSFQRRKSFDLTASLSKPLKYKQYTGKLKPVDFNAKSTFLNNLAQAGGGDKTMLKMNTTGNKPTVNTSSINVLKSITNDNKSGTTPGKKPVIGSSIKSSVSGLRTDKNEMSGNAKAEKLNINLEKSRSLIKKAKTEQTSQIRQQQIDSTRNIENQAVKSN